MSFVLNESRVGAEVIVIGITLQSIKPTTANELSWRDVGHISAINVGNEKNVMGISERIYNSFAILK